MLIFVSFITSLFFYGQLVNIKNDYKLTDLEVLKQKIYLFLNINITVLHPITFLYIVYDNDFKNHLLLYMYLLQFLAGCSELVPGRRHSLK